MMNIYHFSYDIDAIVELNNKELISRQSELCSEYGESLKNLEDVNIIPTVKSTFYIEVDADISQVGDWLNKIFNDIATDSDKQYFALSLDICRIDDSPPTPIWYKEGKPHPLYLHISDIKRVIRIGIAYYHQKKEKDFPAK